MNDSKEIEDDYIIGSDKSLGEVLKGVNFKPLFESAVRAGAEAVIIQDISREVLCQYGPDISDKDFIIKKNLYLEGEPAGTIVISGKAENNNHLEAIGEIVFETAKIIIHNSLKTLLATETHRTVISQSYENLIETNRKLKLSESRYRKLAGNLEMQVQERTNELNHAHTKLLKQEKLVSVGQLAAGIAHEINNPMGFIMSNIHTMEDYASRLWGMIVFYRSVFERGHITDNDVKEAAEKYMTYKLDYISSDMEELIKESLYGSERVKKIVSDLKGFSHIDEVKDKDTDINQEIERTLNVLTHEIRDDTCIRKDFKELPLFHCNPAELCQAFFNIIQNSLQTGQEGLELAIKTSTQGNHIRISFGDNGPGIPDEIKNRIFEPFFSTKEVGKGSGMGLNVTYEIINSYEGTIEVESEPGQGTTIIILLPLRKENR